MSVTPASMLAAGFVALLAAVLGGVAWRRPERRNLVRMGDAAAWAALALVLVLWVLRWIEAGHLPLFGTFESALSVAGAVLLVPTAFRFLRRVPAAE